MSDLVAEIKNRLKLETLVRQSYELVAAGRQLRGKNADGLMTLYVNPEKELWNWWAKGAGDGQKVLGGDALDWIAYQKFGRVHVEGENFVEVLQLACAAAGIDYEKWQAEHQGSGARGQGSEERRRALTERRGKEEILARYVAVSEALRDKEFYVHARQIGHSAESAGKPYLTADVCEQWRLGPAPALEDCLKAGLTENELRSVCLLIDKDEGDTRSSYLFFRKSLLIPHLERGRVIYLSSRYFSNFDGSGKPRERKTLHLKTESGLPRPCGFNLDVLYSAEAREKGLLLVEAPLDAIACCALGHPALGMLGSYPGDELVARLKKVA